MAFVHVDRRGRPHQRARDPEVRRAYEAASSMLTVTRARRRSRARPEDRPNAGTRGRWWRWPQPCRHHARDLARRHGLCGWDARRRHIHRRADGEGSQASGYPRMTLGGPFSPTWPRLSAPRRSAPADGDWRRPRTKGSTISHLWPKRRRSSACNAAESDANVRRDGSRPLKPPQPTLMSAEDARRTRTRRLEVVDRAVHLRARHIAQQGKYFGEQETKLAGKRKCDPDLRRQDKANCVCAPFWRKYLSAYHFLGRHCHCLRVIGRLLASPLFFSSDDSSTPSSVLKVPQNR